MPNQAHPLPNTEATAALAQGLDNGNLGNGCPTLAQRFLTYWENFVHALGNRCPIIGQPLLKYRTLFAQTLLPTYRATSFPSVGQPLPKFWAIVSQVLGNRFPSIGKPFPRYWETVSQALGNGFGALRHGPPLLGERFPNAGKLSPNDWETASQCLCVRLRGGRDGLRRNPAMTRNCELAGGTIPR